MEKLLVWGAGDRTKYFFENGVFDNCNIIAVIDKYYDAREYKGYPIIRPEKINDYIQNVDYIIISNKFFVEIMFDLYKYEVPNKKIIITDAILDEPYYSCFKRMEKVLPKAYRLVGSLSQRRVKLNERDFMDTNSIFKKDIFKDAEYSEDYFRYRTFEFVSEQIIENKICGALAELGVYKGKFAKLINYKFPDRKLYLFDTFSGFNDKEAEIEKKKGRCDDIFINAHKDASVETLLTNLNNRDQVIICKGFFPDSICEEAKTEKYAFVSLDVDFEDSTFEGLKFFYPRLVEGGFIFLHDYNTFFLEGIRCAVKKYENYIGKRLIKLPIADRAGTLIITK